MQIKQDSIKLIDHPLTVKKLNEKASGYRLDLNLAFIDYGKAFASVEPQI